MAPAATEVAPAAAVAIVAVPFPAQGHLNQMLHLSLLLASRGLDVHYAATAAHVCQVRARVQGWDARTVRSLHLHFTALGIPPYEMPPPDPRTRSRTPSTCSRSSTPSVTTPLPHSGDSSRSWPRQTAASWSCTTASRPSRRPRRRG
ncbi:hypothetical protein QYE76_060706 [Lolium multiflorum]|uniref:Glycosyltransferase N-terminal domain-containing protein n=1 Tax=Lolium multiflorum TaxID=4521 RepID=A0AAD8W417_LOLMU|nr:hypothetical protein QYE76_060706 [Lolium multiflorum]